MAHKRHGQAKAAQENYETLMQEFIMTKIQIKEMQGTAQVLEDRLNLAERENKTLFENLKAKELAVKTLTALNKQKEEDLDRKIDVGLIENLRAAGLKCKELEARLGDTRDKLLEKEQTLKATSTLLDETNVELKKTNATLNEFESKLRDAENCIENLTELNQCKERDAFEKEVLIQMLQKRVIEYEVKRAEKQALLASAEKRIEKCELEFNATTAMLNEAQEKLAETEIKLQKFEKQFVVTAEDIDNLRSEGELISKFPLEMVSLSKRYI